MGFSIQATKETILETVARANPEIYAVLKRVRERVPGIKREIAEYQAATLYHIVKPLRGKRANILEIGTAWGYSAAIMSEAAPDAQIYTLNPILEEAELAKEHLTPYPNVHVLIEKSWNYLKEYHGPPFDFVFVDGDHKRVRLDFPWWDHLTTGGDMFFHDYSPAGSYRECPPVYEGLNELRETLGTPFDYLIVDEGSVGMAGFTKGSKMSAKQIAGERQYDLAQAAGASILSYNHISMLYDLAGQIKDLPGAIVECGVTNGGSAAAIYAGARKSLKDNRKLCLYDTWKGIPRPDDQLDGAKPLLKWEAAENTVGGWCKGTFEQVYDVMKALKINKRNYELVEGMFEFLSGKEIPDEIAFLHIDATLYRSTLHALNAFFPQVVSGGIVTVSAYGHWAGVKRATDVFFAERNLDMPHHFIDGINLVYVKP